MPTVQYDVDIDLQDLEDDFKEHYCDRGKCLKDTMLWEDALRDYVKEMEKNLYIYTHKEFKSYEDIYRDLKRIIEEN